MSRGVDEWWAIWKNCAKAPRGMYICMINLLFSGNEVFVSTVTQCPGGYTY